MKTQLFFASLLVATALVGCNNRDDAARDSQGAARYDGAGNTIGNHYGSASSTAGSSATVADTGLDPAGANYGAAHGHDADVGDIETDGDGPAGGLGVGTGADEAGAPTGDRARAAEVYDTGAAANGAADGSASASGNGANGAVLGAMIAHRQQGLELAKLGEQKASKPQLRQIASTLRVADQEALDLLRDQRQGNSVATSTGAAVSGANSKQATVNGRSGDVSSFPMAESARAAEVYDNDVEANDLSRDIDFTQPTAGSEPVAMTDDDFFDTTTRSSASGTDEAPVRGSVGAQNDPAAVAPATPVGANASSVTQAASAGVAVDFSALRSASGATFDRQFVAAVLAHHQAGQSLAQNGGPVSGLSDVIESERQAISQLQSWQGNQQ